MKKAMTSDIFPESKYKQDRRLAAAAAHPWGGGWHDLWAAYKEPSAAKVSAWRRVIRDAGLVNGYDLRIVSRNTFSFSAAFKFLREDGAEMIAYITPGHERVARLSEFA